MEPIIESTPTKSTRVSFRGPQDKSNAAGRAPQQPAHVYQIRVERRRAVDGLSRKLAYRPDRRILLIPMELLLLIFASTAYAAGGLFMKFSNGATRPSPTIAFLLLF